MDPHVLRWPSNRRIMPRIVLARIVQVVRMMTASGAEFAPLGAIALLRRGTGQLGLPLDGFVRG